MKAVFQRGLGIKEEQNYHFFRSDSGSVVVQLKVLLPASRYTTMNMRVFQAKK